MWGAKATLLSALCCAALLALAGCGGQRSATGQPEPAAGASQGALRDAGPATQAALPFPADRAAAGLTENILPGKSAELRSALAADEGTALLLDASAGPVQFAGYRFNPGGNAPDSVSVLLDAVAGPGVFLGLANFSTGRWDFSGPYTTTKTLAIDGGSYVSVAGNIWVAVLAPAGQSATVDALSVRTVNPDNQPPVAALTADVTSGAAPLTVNFDASGSHDPDGSIIEYAWDFDGDGAYEAISDGPVLSHDFSAPGEHAVKVRVTDDQFGRAAATLDIDVTAVDNNPPVAKLVSKGNFGFSPLVVYFDASGSDAGGDPGDSIVKYEWDWQGDGTFDFTSTSSLASHIYFDLYNEVVLRVTDQAGNQAETIGGVSVLPYGGTQLDGAGLAGAGPSMALVGGKPAISYLDYTGQTVCYVRASDTGANYWDNGEVVAPASSNNLQSVDLQSTSLCEVDGRPAIAYAADDQLMYVSATDAQGTAWNAPVLTGVYVDQYASLALTVVDGQPAVLHRAGHDNGPPSYCAGYIRATDADGTAWGAPIVPAVEETADVSGLVTLDGNPAFAYVRGAAGQAQAVCFIRATDAQGGSWGQPTVVTEGLSYQTPVIRTDAEYPSVAFAWRQLDYSDAGVDYIVGEVDGQAWGSPERVAEGDSEYWVWWMARTPEQFSVVYTGSVSGLQVFGPGVFTVDHSFPQGRASVLTIGNQLGIAYAGCRHDWEDLLFVLGNGNF